LGLGNHLWVILTEANEFTWPSAHMVPAIPGERTAFGTLPEITFNQILGTLC
jgi:hypothetical protein